MPLAGPDPRPGQTSLASTQVRSRFSVRRYAEQPPTTISNSEGWLGESFGVVNAAPPGRRRVNATTAMRRQEPTHEAG